MKESGTRSVMLQGGSIYIFFFFGRDLNLNGRTAAQSSRLSRARVEDPIRRTQGWRMVYIEGSA